MPAAAWVTLIIAALIIAITAVGLLRVIFHLRAIRATLVATTGGLFQRPAAGRASSENTGMRGGRAGSVSALSGRGK